MEKPQLIDLIALAQRGDYTGMNFVILARLSTEAKSRKRAEKRAKAEKKGKKLAVTGMDINNRDEQVNACTERIESRGGKVVFVYMEPHTSAWKKKRVQQPDGTFKYLVVRPVYRKVLADMAKGVCSENGERIDALMILDVDRLTRDNRDLEDAIDVVVYNKRPILDWRGSLDLLTEYGRTQARGIVAHKNGQSADTAFRVSQKHKAMQREGIPAGGTRPFGWKKDRRTLHKTEAPLLKAAALDVLGGRSRNSIVAEWNKAGILTSRGNAWTVDTLTLVLRNPRICGHRMISVQNVDENNGETLSRHVVTLLDDKGKPVKGKWKRIIKPEQWEALVEIIGERPNRGDGRNARKYLFTGTLRCGKDGCDQRLRAIKATASAGKPEGFFYYQCPSTSQGGCGGIRIDGWEVDKYLSKIVVAKYEQQTAKREAVAAPAKWTKEAELAAVQEDIADLKKARRERKISAERYYADLNEYEAELSKLSAERNAFLRKQYAAAGKPVNLRQDWPGLTLAEQRAYVERTLSAVTVLPAGGKRRVPVETRLIPVPVADDAAA